MRRPPYADNTQALVNWQWRNEDGFDAMQVVMPRQRDACQALGTRQENRPKIVRKHLIVQHTINSAEAMHSKHKTRKGHRDSLSYYMVTSHEMT